MESDSLFAIMTKSRTHVEETSQLHWMNEWF